MLTNAQRGSELALLCRIGSGLCALPLEVVSETMRPLAIRPLVGAPDFVLGISIIRSEPLPVIDASCFIGDRGSAAPKRFVVLEVGARRVALAVDDVESIRALEPAALAALPPLLHSTPSDVVASIGVLDGELLLVLRTLRMVPDATWQVVDAETASS